MKDASIKVSRDARESECPECGHSDRISMWAWAHTHELLTYRCPECKYVSKLPVGWER